MTIPVGTKAQGPDGHMIVMTANGWAELGTPQMAIPTDSQPMMDKLGQESQEASFLAQKANQFHTIQQGSGPGDVTNTGFQYGDLRLPVPFLHEFNLNPLPTLAGAVNPRISDMESISNQAWTHMRPAGSGPMRMPEIEGFQHAFPNVENSPQANSDITARLGQDAALAAAKLQFIDDYIKGGKGDYAGANAAWQQQANAGITEAPLAPVGGGQRDPSYQPAPAVFYPPRPGDPGYPIQMPPSASPPALQGGGAAAAPPPPAAPQILTWDPQRGIIR